MQNSRASAKLLYDGVIDGHTAVLLAPYADKPSFSGTPIWKNDSFTATIVELDRQGFQIDVHAIGNGAVRATLDAFEKARKVNGERDSRNKISHIQLVSPQDYSRFKDLGVIAALQPNWFYYDTNAFKVTADYLGKEQAEQMYTLKSLADAGIMVSFGSDWPVGTDDIPLNPLDGIESAVTRKPFQPAAEPVPVFRPDQRVSLKYAIEAATINGAYASFMESETGSIEPGKLADLVILDRNIFTLPPEEINTAVVVSTYLAGKEVYHR